MGPRGVNEKKRAGLEKKANVKAAKDQALAREEEKAIGEEWKKGANIKGQAKAEAAAQKADEAARKKREKAALLAAEEENSGSTKIKKEAGAGMSAKKSKKYKKKNELSLLEDTLVEDAEKKLKIARKNEIKKRAELERLQAEREKAMKYEKNNRDLLLGNTDDMIGNSLNEEFLVRSANVASADGRLDASGMESALNSLSLTSNDVKDIHPEKRMKALHKAFEERMMPKVKEEYPGLRLSQYKEKIFELWKKSPENPMNWPKDS